MRMKLAAVFFAISVLYILFDSICGLAQELETGIQDTKAAEAHRKMTSEFIPMTATAYCLSGKTATGTQTRAGIAASKKEWFGKTARVYWNDCGTPGELIGEYVIEDTGGEPIRNGSVIDVWLPTYEECMKFGRRLVLVEIMDD